MARNKLILVVAPDHPWAECSSLAPEALLESDWVLRERGSGTRSEFEQALTQFGVPVKALRVALELPANEAVRAAVEAELGATAISASVAAPSLEAGLLHHVKFALPERDFHVVRHADRYQSHVATSFMAMLTNS